MKWYYYYYYDYDYYYDYYYYYYYYYYYHHRGPRGGAGSRSSPPRAPWRCWRWGGRPCVYVCVYIYIYIYIYVSLSLSIYIYIYVYTYIRMYVYVCIVIAIVIISYSTAILAIICLYHFHYLRPNGEARAGPRGRGATLVAFTFPHPANRPHRYPITRFSWKMGDAFRFRAKCAKMASRIGKSRTPVVCTGAGAGVRRREAAAGGSAVYVIWYDIIYYNLALYIIV